MGRGDEPGDSWRNSGADDRGREAGLKLKKAALTTWTINGNSEIKK